MLAKLFGSNSRVKLLKLFLLNPDKKFYIRQIARDLELQVNSVRRELDNLEKFGLLMSDLAKGDGTEEEIKPGDTLPANEALRSTGLLEMAANRAKTAPAVTEEVKDNQAAGRQEKKYYRADANFVLFEEIRALFTKAQILYEKDFIDKLSSVGQPKLLVLSGLFVNGSTSPVDILMVGKVPKDKFLRILKELEAELGREINYTIMDEEEFIYRRDMTDVFLYSILESRKIVAVDAMGLWQRM
jgi:hypothetical protein